LAGAWRAALSVAVWGRLQPSPLQLRAPCSTPHPSPPPPVPVPVLPAVLMSSGAVQSRAPKEVQKAPAEAHSTSPEHPANATIVNNNSNNNNNDDDDDNNNNNTRAHMYTKHG